MKENIFHIIKQYLYMMWKDTKKYGLIQHASALAYFTLLSIIPSMALLLFISSLFSPYLSDSVYMISQIRNFVFNNFEQSSGKEIVHFIKGAIENIEINKIGIIGLLGAIYANLLLVRQVETALNGIWHIKDNRKIIRRALGFLIFTLGGSLVIILSYSFTKNWYNSFHQITDHQYVGFFQKSLIWMVFLSIIYKVIPNCKVSLKGALGAAFIVGITLQLLVHYYAYYALIATNYRSIYGTLASLPIFLVWLQCMWLVTLFGAIISRRILVGVQEA